MTKQKRDNRDHGTDTRFKPMRWEYDILQKDFIPRQFPRPVPPTNIFDDAVYCLRFNELWLPHILGALQLLLEKDSWAGDENTVFRAQQSIYAMLESLTHPCGEEPCENGECIAYFPTDSVFSYEPNNPFLPCETPPAGYLTCPLRLGLNTPIPGLLPDDVVCYIPSLLPAPPLGLIDQILNSGFPRIHMEFNGSGEVEVHLIEVAQGGLAIIRIDDVAQVNVVNLQGISLSDIRASLDFIIDVGLGILNWNFVTDKIVEFNVGHGDHTLDIIFIPNLSLNILETGWGGGFRKVVLCGEFTAPACPDVIDPIGGGMLFDLCWFDTEDGRILRYTINGGCTWVDVGSCNGADVVVPNPPIITDPIDNPGTTPGTGTALTACMIAEDVYGWMYLNRMVGLLSLLEVNADDAGALQSAIVSWITGAGFGFTVERDYDIFSTLLDKYNTTANVASLVCVRDDELWWIHMQCQVLELASNDITRSEMTSVSETIDGMTLVNCTSENYVVFKAFVKDFTRAFAVSSLRLRAVSIVGLSVDAEWCEECADPGGGGEVSCDFREEDDFVAQPNNNFGFEEMSGEADSWLAPTGINFFGLSFQEVIHTNAGMQIGVQTDPPTKALGIVKLYEEDAYGLCTAYIKIATSTGKGNSRAAALWVQDVLGGWTCIAKKFFKIGYSGSLDLYYNGDRMLIRRIAVVVAAGKPSTCTVLKVDLNYNVLPA